jgi:pyruvate dehydrogenase E1 component
MSAYQSPSAVIDSDVVETTEWLESFDALDPTRALFLLRRLEEHARELGLLAPAATCSPYRNTLPLTRQGQYPGDLAIEERLTSIMRWNALAMVTRANKAYGELGGHIASYASAAEIFEVGFNHFFQAACSTHGGDLVYFQPHSAPGIYARAFLEGRLSAEQLANYRQEVAGNGLCSYPHPWLMPEFWQVPSGSMGIGPINAIYQARFMRYMADRGLADTANRRIWGVFGDGEMDEPESIGALTLAARERLDNLTFIINCNLQRLDGPVRGNGQIIQELESLFVGVGWNVIKVIWGSDWDPLFARDTHHALLRGLASLVDGAYQNLGSKDGAYNVEHFFKKDAATQALVAHMTDAEIAALKRGGHDFRKLYAAFAAAKCHAGQPTVILAKTKKGYGMGNAGESRMTSHQAKKPDVDALKAFRDRFQLPLSDAEVEHLNFYRPDENSRELTYLRQRRAALGGALPARRRESPPIPVPALTSYAQFALAAGNKEMSTTIAAVRMLSGLLRDKRLGPRIVPIVADEARTFGMANLFRQIGIYSPVGQLYEPEDAGSMLYYKEAKDGQLLEEGITEAGALSSWAAAGTAYSVHGVAMLPFYIYYSIFGFQRVGDLIWAAADQRTRGFLFGATTVPNCRAYDPAFAYELAVILDHGMRRMMEQQADEFYYITLMNENYAQPSLPAYISHADVLSGMYRYKHWPVEHSTLGLRLLGSGAILREVIAAADLLAQDWNVGSEVYSVTSFSELAREAAAVQRWNRHHPLDPPQTSRVKHQLQNAGLVVAATDYVRAYPQLIAPYVDARFVTLGTDGFGRSDTRMALRRFFEVDRHSIVLATLDALAHAGQVSAQTVAQAIDRYGIDTQSAAPWTR